MDSEVLDPDDVPRFDLSENDAVPPDLDVRVIDDAMGLENLRAKLWYFEPGEEVRYHAHAEQEEFYYVLQGEFGEEVRYHAHAEQEEFYYVLQGEFSVKHGRSGEAEIEEVGPGDVFAAGPGIGHGHRYLGDDEGVVLAVSAPAVEDPGQDPHELD